MRRVESQIIPIEMSDIDTDILIPAQFLTTTTKQGLGKYLFHRMMNQDPHFPFHQKKYQKGQILVAGRNFGCGSSREHAAWALADYGIRVVLAPSFSDIFYNNALKNQLLPVMLPETVIDSIFEEEKTSPHYYVHVDLEEEKVRLPNGELFSFEIDPYRKECLIKNIDDLDYLLSKKELIEAHFKKHPPLFSLESIQIREVE